MNEIRNLNADKHGRCYTDVVKAFTMTVFYYIPHTHTFLHSMFCLPSIDTLIVSVALEHATKGVECVGVLPEDTDIPVLLLHQ